MYENLRKDKVDQKFDQIKRDNLLKTCPVIEIMSYLSYVQADNMNKWIQSQMKYVDNSQRRYTEKEIKGKLRQEYRGTVLGYGESNNYIPYNDWKKMYRPPGRHSRTKDI